MAGAFAATTAFTVPPASANIFETIFGGGNRLNQPYASRHAYPDAPPAPEPRRAAPRISIPKVSGPSYYDYTAPQPVHVDFSSVLATRDYVASVEAPSSGDIGLNGTSFRDALGGLVDFDLTADKEVAAALVEYYAQNPDFIWVSGYGADERADRALEVLGEAGEYGLTADDYTVERPRDYFVYSRRAERARDLMRFEMTMSARVLRYVKDASRGLVDPNKLSGYHDFPDRPIDLVAILEDLATTGDARAFMLAQHPQNPEYRALRDELAALRGSTEREIVIDPDILVHPGESNPDFPKVLAVIERDADADFMAEWGDVIAANAGSDLYSRDLVPVIKAAQKMKSLHVDGVVGPRTVRALAGESRASRIEKVKLALERLRWHPSRLGNPHVFINAAAFTASFVEDGKTALTMRAVVGRPSNQTSFFHDEIEYVQFNPYWGVPRSIIVNEMLPKLLRDPSYLDRAGYEVTDSKGRHISSASIDWARIGPHIPYDIRQVPSERNALGVLKIMFPNKNAIYMHDTPQKYLFERDMRAYSHGCVRLQHPREMAAEVLGSTVAHVNERLSRGHNRENVPHKIPVYVAYFTAWPDDAGKVHYYGDIYDRDAHLSTALVKREDARRPPLKVAGEG